ncbi:Nuclear pore complex protein Nup85 [Abortiporus biennis]
MARKASSSLNPPLFNNGSGSEFIQSGRNLAIVPSPRDSSLAIFPINNANPTLLKPNYPKVAPIYFASEYNPPSGERRTFLTDTSIIWAALQNLLKTSEKKDFDIQNTDAILSGIRKLAIDYINFCKECWVYASQAITRSDPLQFNGDHYRKLYTCFSLFTVLYLPDTGFDNAPVGEELMDWLNTHYIEPATEEGDHLSSLERPWEDEIYWSYLTRTTLRGLSKASSFFLETLTRHPSHHLPRLSQQLIPLLTNHPRLQQFHTERDFAIASRRWRDKVKVLRIELDRVPEDVRDDGFDNWWDRFSDLVGILEGREEVVKRLCKELGADWKEVAVAWGVFIDPRLRRQDLPEVVLQVLDDIPADLTDLENCIISSLFLGKPVQALAVAAKLDIWLAAHLADLVEAIELIDRDPDDSGVSIRQRYVIAYAEYLHSDPGLWRLTVNYLYSCGDMGTRMADEILMRVPLRIQSIANEGERTQIRNGQLAGIIKEISATCFENNREEIRRAILRIAAQTFLKERDYGLAVSYCTSAEDWQGIGRVVDCVLDEYTRRGPEKFSHQVANIAPSLHALRAESAPALNGVYIYRLIFAVRLAEYHQRKSKGELQDAAVDVIAIFKDEIAPKSWWAVVLYDSIELLQTNEHMLFTSAEAGMLLHKLEEIFTLTSYGLGSDYLPVFMKVLKNSDEKYALQRLQIVRLALAKYFARCGVIGAGGKYGSGLRR